ncbi:MAG TPA: signal peptidase I [Desulfomonilia bacterium]|jgi:signal peptidase I
MDKTANEPVVIKKKGALREWAEALVVAFILAMIIKAFILGSYWVPSSSMEDTVFKNDWLLATKFNYGSTIPFTTDKLWGKDIVPGRGDVIIFSFPLDKSVDFVKRVVGLPGERIAIKDKKVFINGRELVLGHEKYTEPLINSGEAAIRDNMPEMTIPQGTVFVMGDNRDNSFDSRFWGPLSIQNIKGKALILYFSWDKDHILQRLGRIGHVIR